MTYYIPEGNIKQFETRITRLVRRAIKLGSQLAYEINRNDFRDEKVEFTGADNKKHTTFVRRFRVDVIGEEPKYNGWKFIGTLEHTDEGNVLRMVPGHVAPEQYRDCAPFCEHCKAKRLRKDTYLVHHTVNGTTTQVGSTCLVDFLGHENPQALAKLSEIWVSINELTGLAEDHRWLGGGGHYISKDRQDLIQFLSFVAEIVAQDKTFWSRSAVQRIIQSRGGNDHGAPEMTAWKAARCMNPYGPEDRRDASKYTPSEDSIQMAIDARDWALSEYGEALPDGGSYDEIKAALLHAEKRDLSDFEHNLLVVAKGEFCERRTFGIAAYIIEAYRKAKGLVPQRKARPVSNHFGTVGQRFPKLEVTVEKVHTWNSEQFGTGFLFKMRTADGDVAVWRTYNVSDENDMVEGKRYVVACTVKEHSDYNKEKQTVMSRLKVGLGLLDVAAVQAPVPQPENLEPGDDYVPTDLQLVAA